MRSERGEIRKSQGVKLLNYLWRACVPKEVVPFFLAMQFGAFLQVFFCGILIKILSPWFPNTAG